MNRRSIRLFLLLLCLVAFPHRSPAPLIYTPGEGWTYEPVGGEGKWRRTRAKDQLEVATTAFNQKQYSLALKAARRVVSVWPLSDYAPEAQFLVAKSYEARGRDEKAFKEYQKILEKYPKLANFDEVLQHQVLIADRFLAGKWFKLWGFIPAFSSMDRTAGMYEKIVRNGPYSDIAPQAQLKVGTAREKQKNYSLAAKAFETAADRYHDRPQIAAEAIFRQGLAYEKLARKAEYDQSTASQATATFTDFITLFPAEPRAAEAQKIITALKAEQAIGNYKVARFYERSRKWSGALVYYNEVVLQDPNSSYAAEARQRIEVLKRRIQKPKS